MYQSNKIPVGAKDTVSLNQMVEKLKYFNGKNTLVSMAKLSSEQHMGGKHTSYTMNMGRKHTLYTKQMFLETI